VTDFVHGDELRRSAPEEPGIVRRRRGRGFSYHWPDGRAVRDPVTLRRIRELAVPPAWTEVWICRAADGHLQAVGTDSAGRRQYRYHDLWRKLQDREKFDRVLEFAGELTRFREVVEEHLSGRGLTRTRVLAAAARMLDIGFFRVGGEEYTDSFGLATLRAEHVTYRRGTVVCSYVAKGRKAREQVISDPAVCRVIRSLLADPGEELLRYKKNGAWRDVQSDEVNAYLKEVFGREVSAKDFRTWHATVLAAVGLAVSSRARTDRGRRRAVTRVMGEVADYLGNTPAVARASYVDPRIIDLYLGGTTIDLAGLAKGDPVMATHGAAESAVLELLRATPWPDG